METDERGWSFALSAALTLAALWGFHAFCDAFVAGEIPYPARGETPTPAREVCWRGLGPVTWSGVAGLLCLGLSWVLPRTWTGAPAGLVRWLALGGRVVALLLLGGLALVVSLYGWLGA